MKKVLIALGGNALGSTPSEQKKAIKVTAKTVVDLVEAGNEVVICHGNGPQVGMINNSFAAAMDSKTIKEMMPFPECGAMSQGYIGYHIQNAINNELAKRGVKKNVVSLVTQTLVDKNDTAFNNPTKPIGGFMSEEEAKSLAETNKWIVKEDAGRGWRRVIASPKPIDVIEKDSIVKLLEDKTIVIAGGGGGIPVYKDGNDLIGIDAVIDKDWTASKMAELIHADTFIILTAVDYIILNYGTPNQEPLKEVSLEDLKGYILDDQFAPGSMLPKVEAVVSFVKNTSKDAYIGELSTAGKILSREAGSRIYQG